MVPRPTCRVILAAVLSAATAPPTIGAVIPGCVEAAKATPPGCLEELLILALRRELRIAEATHTSCIRELHVLVYGDEPDPADEDEAPAEPDPILALIEANRTAEAAIDAFGREASARAEAEPSLSAAQVDSWRAVYQTRPTTLAGLAALSDWIDHADALIAIVDRLDGEADDEDGADAGASRERGAV
nr:hypothetical protein [Methylobacterium sp. L1A1]